MGYYKFKGDFNRDLCGYFGINTLHYIINKFTRKNHIMVLCVVLMSLWSLEWVKGFFVVLKLGG